MSRRQRLSNDPYVGALEKRSSLALEWYNEIAAALKEDLDEFTEQEVKGPGPSFVLENLALKLSGDLPDCDDKQTARCELALSTRCARVRMVANDPTGWIYLEVSKMSPIFDGVLHRGAIELVLIPHGSSHDEIHFVECDWLNPDGSETPKNGEQIADKLWDILFLPKVRHQLAAAQRSAGH